MNKEYELAMKAGLADGGKDAEGNQLYIGTEKQWEEFERLKQEELEGRGIPGFENTYDDLNKITDEFYK